MLEKNETVRILADSYVPKTQARFTTFLIKFPKCLLAELNTHRQLSRSCASSRAIPFSKMIQSVIDDPYIPSFTHNQPGMQGVDDVTDVQLSYAKDIWLNSLGEAVMRAEQLNRLGLHKQEINRLLEPYKYVEVVISGTEWEHFFNLRTAENVQPDFRKIAIEMQSQYNSNAINNRYKYLDYGDWHIPFSDMMPNDIEDSSKLKIAIARCARVSYENHGGNHSVEKDLDLYNMLYKDKHQCYDAKTEILTNSGWKKFYELNIDDKVLTVSPETRESKFEQPSAIHEYDYNGELYSVKAQQLDLLVTPNHRMYVSYRKSGGIYSKFYFDTAENIGNSSKKYCVSSQLINTKNIVSPIEKLPIDKFLKLLGFFIGDGHANANSIIFHIKKQRKVDYIYSIFENTDFKINKWANNTYSILLGTWFKDNCYEDKEKIIPKDFRNITELNYFNLCDGLKNSDGSLKRNTWVYDTTSKKLAEQIQILAHLNNQAVSFSITKFSELNPLWKNRYRLNFSTRIYPEVSPNQQGRTNMAEVKYVPYKGKVYCVSVSTGLVMVRRNGKVSLSGNSPTEHLAMATPVSFLTPDSRVFGFENLDGDFIYTRQYKGFYTYRAMLEDNTDPIQYSIDMKCI